MKGLFALAFCLLLSSCIAEQTSEEIYLEKYMAALNSTGIPLDQILANADEVQSFGVNFDCPKMSDFFIKTRPTSVHELSPHHVQIVGAVGDSVTEGFGAMATNILQALTKYRGVSWSVGGDNDVFTTLTIPNIIKQYNPNVKGASLGTSDKDANFNLAKAGAVAKDIPGQVDALIDKIKNSGVSGMNVEEDWKLITVWIGGNDLCAYCDDKEGHSPKKYVQDIEKGLDKLKKELPRTYVNMVEILDITPLAEVVENLGFLDKLVCGAVHSFTCNCARDKNKKGETHDAYMAYNDELEALVDSGKYDTDDDFTVVLQPFFKNLLLPSNPKDAKDFLGLDCFHFNGRGHAQIALQLWNEIMTPDGDDKRGKDFKLDGEQKLICPTDEVPYFYTLKNSKSFFGAANSNPDSSDNADSTPNLLGILLGTSLTTFTVAVAVILGVIAVAYTRHRRRRNSMVRSVTVGMSVDTEKTRLIFRQ